jgi:hypothetical protein
VICLQTINKVFVQYCKPYANLCNFDMTRVLTTLISPQTLLLVWTWSLAPRDSCYRCSLCYVLVRNSGVAWEVGCTFLCNKEVYNDPSAFAPLSIKSGLETRFPHDLCSTAPPILLCQCTKLDTYPYNGKSGNKKSGLTMCARCRPYGVDK